MCINWCLMNISIIEKMHGKYNVKSVRVSTGLWQTVTLTRLEETDLSSHKLYHQSISNHKLFHAILIKP